MSSQRLHLVPDQQYRVIKPFTDADATPHLAGEEWTFIGSKFSRFEDEYVIFVRFGSGITQSFGLICEESKQYEIVRHFREYVTKI
jgi:hypothetical protein